MRAICAAGFLIVLCGIAALPANALRGPQQTATCQTISAAEALEALEDTGEVFAGWGTDTPVRAVHGARRFKGREIDCQWSTRNVKGWISVLVAVLPTPAEATRFFNARGMCFRKPRIAVGAVGCGGPGDVFARSGRFAITVSGAISRDGSVISSRRLAALAKAVFSRAPRVFAGR
jgi:hypothetical protein